MNMEIKLTFLTPTFLYGANPTEPEFRIASLIGQMRYWWRMTQDWSSIPEMRKRESEIFGLGDSGAKSFYIWLIEKTPIKTEAKKQVNHENNTIKYVFNPTTIFIFLPVHSFSFSDVKHGLYDFAIEST